MRTKSALSSLVTVSLALLAVGCGIGADSSSNTVDESCSPVHEFPTIEEGKLIVSTYVSPPYSSQNGPDFGGIDSAIIKKIAEMECLELEQNPVAGAALISSVQSKRADIAIGGVYRTAEREQLLNLSATMYRDGMALLGKQDLKTIEDLQGKSVGVIQGYLWNEELQKVLGQDSVKIYQASDGLFNDLKLGRLDVGVLTSAEAAFRAEKNPDTGLKVNEIASDHRVASSRNPGEVVLAHTKGNTKMTEALNSNLKTLLEDGTIDKIVSENGMDASLAGGR